MFLKYFYSFKIFFVYKTILVIIHFLGGGDLGYGAKNIEKHWFEYHLIDRSYNDVQLFYIFSSMLNNLFVIP